MPRESNLEMKVGVFVVAARLCLVGFVFSISDFSFFKKGDSYHVTFHYAGGLKKGAPVRLAGVDVGYVRDIHVNYQPVPADLPGVVSFVAVNIWIEAGQHIARDSKFSINQLGLLGEKYLEIIPGVLPESLLSGATVMGEDPVSMEDVMKMVSVISIKLQETLANVNEGILTPQNKSALAASLANMVSITDGVRTGFLSDANKVALAAVLANMATITEGVKQGEGTVGKLLTDPAIFRNLDELSADLKANPWKLLYRPRKTSP
ncbi:MAG: MlaD family protein [Candidatus Omnitrophota bacterium]